MLSIIFSYFILLLLFHSSNSLEEGQLHVTFINLFDKTISVFYDDGKYGYFINEIPASQSVDINTFVGHKFYATFVGKLDRVAEVTAKFGQSIYYVGDVWGHDSENVGLSLTRRVISSDNDSTRRTLNVAFRQQDHSLVLPLTEVSPNGFTVFAKFRSISPRTLDFWFDDGGEGIYQGFLLSGAETTSSTAPGHVFYATEVFNFIIF